MFQKILVAVDGSNVSKHAFKKAVDEAKIWKGELSAVYVVETGLFSSIPLDNTLEVIYSLLDKEGQEVLKECMESAESAGIDVNTVIKQGHAGNEILNCSEELGCDLLVLGSHGKSEVDRLLLGSVTDHVVRHSKITTMVVRL